MKNRFYIIAGILLLSTSLSAQITLTQVSYPTSVVGTDSLKKTTYNSSFPSLAASASGVWDMSIVTDTTPVYFAYRVPTSTYPFADSNYYSLGSYTYQGNVESSITTSGILQYGIVTPLTGYSLTSLTFGASDSLIIPSQISTYSSPFNKLSFPTTYHTFWSTTYSSDFNFQITISFASYSHAPGIVRTYSTTNDTVTGWGKMRVKDALGNPSSYFDVLQVQTTTTTIDSFFINGSPASVVVLGPLGLTQGKQDTTYQQSYYRSGEVTPLAQVTFKDASFTQPKSATTHVQRMINAAVPNVGSDDEVKVYPNPVTGSFFSIELPAVAGKWTYDITDVAGRQVVSGKLQPTGNFVQIRLPVTIATGIYYLKLMNDGVQVRVKQINISR